MCHPKTAHIVCAAPAGFNPSRLPRLNGGPSSQERKQRQKQQQPQQNSRNAKQVAFAFAYCF